MAVATPAAQNPRGAARGLAVCGPVRSLHSEQESVLSAFDFQKKRSTAYCRGRRSANSCKLTRLASQANSAHQRDNMVKSSPISPHPNPLPAGEGTLLFGVLRKSSDHFNTTGNSTAIIVPLPAACF